MAIPKVFINITLLQPGYTEIPNIVAASQAQNIIRLIGDAKNINCQYIKEGEKQVTYRGLSAYILALRKVGHLNIKIKMFDFEACVLASKYSR